MRKTNRSLFVWLIVIVVVGGLLLWAAAVSFTRFRQNNYSLGKAVSVIQNCQAKALGGYGPQPYLFLKTDPNKAIKVSGGDQARQTLVAAAQTNAVSCNYKLDDFGSPTD